MSLTTPLEGRFDPVRAGFFSLMVLEAALPTLGRCPPAERYPGSAKDIPLCKEEPRFRSTLDESTPAKDDDRFFRYWGEAGSGALASSSSFSFESESLLTRMMSRSSSWAPLV